MKWAWSVELMAPLECSREPLQVGGPVICYAGPKLLSQKCFLRVDSLLAKLVLQLLPKQNCAVLFSCRCLMLSVTYLQLPVEFMDQWRYEQPES